MSAKDRTAELASVAAGAARLGAASALLDGEVGVGPGLPTGFRVRDAVWLEPTMVCEVAFMEWTGHGHIRHPSYQGLRPDKEAGEVVREVAGKVPVLPERLR